MAGIDLVAAVSLYLWFGLIVTFALMKFDIVRGWKALIHVFLWPFTLALLLLLELLAAVAKIPRAQ